MFSRATTRIHISNDLSFQSGEETTGFGLEWRPISTFVHVSHLLHKNSALSDGDALHT